MHVIEGVARRHRVIHAELPEVDAKPKREPVGRIAGRAELATVASPQCDVRLRVDFRPNPKIVVVVTGDVVVGGEQDSSSVDVTAHAEAYLSWKRVRGIVERKLRTEVLNRGSDGGAGDLCGASQVDGRPGRGDGCEVLPNHLRVDPERDASSDRSRKTRGHRHVIDPELSR